MAARDGVEEDKEGGGRRLIGGALGARFVVTQSRNGGQYEVLKRTLVRRLISEVECKNLF